jgi:hypothetical protein
MLTRETLLENRGEFVLKPCQYGGSHGVLPGLTVRADVWKQKVVEIWDDPGWVVQVFHAPISTSANDVVSLGLQNFDGTLGGFLVRTGASVLVSARDAALIAAVPVS